ncbi:MAG: Biopolymer transport protein ExbB [Spirochaetes bacterium ADurb.Bin269]|nr:MAG: Biopolymer transport protein ExbB [Spirochaetes bacterium ADurb.Bin269]HPX48584.1 MotA/TolQ/ExbB proton channel family protein [Treponemataceae bacterium]
MNDEWSLLELFHLGGVFMWPLLAFSVATIALAIERTAYLLYHNMNVSTMKKEVLSRISAGDREGAADWLRAQPRRNTAATIFLAILANARHGENRMEKAAEAEAQERIRRCENGFNYLTALASLSPLTGFLGTVSGMIGAFKSIASATEVNAQLVAGGIYEALITTVFGLCIAIVALVAYNILVQRVDRFAGDIVQASSEIIPALLDAEQIGEATEDESAARFAEAAGAAD